MISFIKSVFDYFGSGVTVPGTGFTLQNRGQGFTMQEGLPNTVMEAMAAGLPVVATAVGGTPEVVVDGVTGILVPPRSPDALAEAISTLLQDPDLRRKMGQAGKERVRQCFSVVQMVRTTEALYEELLYLH